MTAPARRWRGAAPGLLSLLLSLPVASLLTSLAWALHAAPAAAGELRSSPPASPDARAAERSDEHAWRLFAALNQPLAPAAGAAGDPAEEAAVVWEGWANAKAIFRPDGADPGPWPGDREPQRASALARFDGLPLSAGTPIRRITGGVMTPVTDPISVVSHLNETRMNRVSFDYIRQRGLFAIDGQIAALRSGIAVDFPAGSRHLKAQWEPIGASQRTHFFCREVLLPDGRRRLYGLTALHIVSKDRPHWFWATFEHVDEPVPPGPGWRAGTGLEGTAWQHYRLRGTMTDYLDASGRPALLANSRLEAGVRPGTSSCISCHARATVGMEQGRVVRLPMFDDQAGGKGSEESEGNATRRLTQPRPGFIGLPAPLEAAGSGHTGRAGDGAAVHWARMDFVWTLARARPDRAGSSTAVAPAAATTATAAH